MTKELVSVIVLNTVNTSWMLMIAHVHHVKIRRLKMSNTVTLSKHEMVVDRYSEIHIAMHKGKIIQVDGLPDDWEYTVHDVDEDTDEDG